MSDQTYDEGFTQDENQPTPNHSKPWLNQYPAGVDWHKTYHGKPLYTLLDQAVATYPNHTLTNFMGVRKTYGEIGDLVNRTALGLQKLGIGKNTKVGLLLPNSPTYIIFYFAALKTGATIVNYNPLYTIDELRFQVENSETEYLVTLDLKLLFDKAEALLDEGHLKAVIYDDFAALLPGLKQTLFKLLKGSSRAKIDTARYPKLIPAAKLQSHGTITDVPTIDPDEDIAVLQYTGGTTGRPKGAMLTHSNLYINILQAGNWDSSLTKGEEKVMGILPFFHVFAMTMVMNYGIYWGAEIILVPKFELKDALKTIKKMRPTTMPGVPTLYNAMMNSGAPASTFASLKLCMSGGAPLPQAVKEGFEKVSGCNMFEGYGLSETSPILTANPVRDSDVVGSIGLPIPQTLISIRDLDDPSKEIPLGENGEICASGPQVMKGYWHNEQATQDVMVGNYFRTGDVGYMDENGYTFIVDRLKDMIICSGFNVYPRRIEDVIYEIDAVEEVTVIGIPNEYRGEAPKAFVKLRDGHSVTSQTIMDHLKTKLSKIELPEEIEFRDELPKTMVGKLSKKELRET